MRKLCNAEAELKKTLLIKKIRVVDITVDITNSVNAQKFEVR